MVGGGYVPRDIIYSLIKGASGNLIACAHLPDCMYAVWEVMCTLSEVTLL